MHWNQLSYKNNQMKFFRFYYPFVFLYSHYFNIFRLFFVLFYFVHWVIKKDNFKAKEYISHVKKIFPWIKEVQWLAMWKTKSASKIQITDEIIGCSLLRKGINPIISRIVQQTGLSRCKRQPI